MGCKGIQAGCGLDANHRRWPILETDYGQVIYNEIQSFAPLRTNLEQAIQFIDQADICAVGERTCRCNYENAPYTETIFLNELAKALIEMGKAKMVSTLEAASTLKRYPGYPIMISKEKHQMVETIDIQNR